MGLKSIKVAGHNLLHRLGLDINKYHPPGSLPTPIESRRNALIQANKISVVLDVGANTGQYAMSVRRFGYGGRIISFEPITTVFNRLSSNCAADPKWECRKLALGAESKSATIHVAGNNGESSSILPMCDRHIAEAPKANYVAEETIQIETLDSVLQGLITPADRVWLKIDVQGFEFSVLEGAVKTMPRIFGLEIELSLVPLYQGAPALIEALQRVTSMGFNLVGVEDVFIDSTGMRSLQLAGIFERA